MVLSASTPKIESTLFAAVDIHVGREIRQANTRFVHAVPAVHARFSAFARFSLRYLHTFNVFSTHLPTPR